MSPPPNPTVLPDCFNPATAVAHRHDLQPSESTYLLSRSRAAPRPLHQR
ncbi:hypothetical protein HanXRQr2_Chr10g0422861 [Helianthus annuus]|uniref:Uncharacterized protein n=1 Tax=Helianthus annuus TaxID=4232 RepID=A0A9K3HUL1_HELAN|nr:hypothetical protein HanXRQr2_Chr10g0422861 [Helianthus annuus]